MSTYGIALLTLLPLLKRLRAYRGKGIATDPSPIPEEPTTGSVLCCDKAGVKNQSPNAEEPTALAPIQSENTKTAPTLTIDVSFAQSSSSVVSRHPATTASPALCIVRGCGRDTSNCPNSPILSSLSVGRLVTGLHPSDSISVGTAAIHKHREFGHRVALKLLEFDDQVIPVIDALLPLDGCMIGEVVQETLEIFEGLEPGKDGKVAQTLTHTWNLSPLNSLSNLP